MSAELKGARDIARAFAEQHVAALALELLDWQDTGLLCGGVGGRLRELALLAVPFSGDHSMQVAESMAKRAALERVGRATPAPGAPADGAQRWLAVVQKHAASARKNAEELRAHPSMEQEARARELAAQYLIETAQCMAMDETHAAMLQQIVDSAGKISALRAMLDAAPGAPGQEAAAVHKDSLTTQTAAVQAVGAWQDIATAPKDGGEVLLWLRAPWSRVEALCWSENLGGWLIKGIEPEDAEGFCGALVPTHWMPMPPPPSGAGEKTS